MAGKDNPMWGKHPVLSEEHKNKIKITQIQNMKPVLLYNVETKEIIQEFESIKSAARETNIHKSVVQEQCRMKPNKKIRRKIRFILKEDLNLWKKFIM